MAPRGPAPLLLAGLAALAAAEKPPCAMTNIGYVDPSVMFVNGGVVTDSQTCQRTCADVATCYVFTYYPGDGACWLQGDGLELQEMQGALSGPKVCRDADGSTLMPIVGSLPALPALPTLRPPEVTGGAEAPAKDDVGDASSEGDISSILRGDLAHVPQWALIAAAAAALALVCLVAYCITPAGKAARKPKRAKRSLAELPETSAEEEGKPLMEVGSPRGQPPLLMSNAYSLGSMAGLPQYPFQGHQALSMMMPQQYQYSYLDPYGQPVQPVQYMQQPMAYMQY